MQYAILNMEHLYHVRFARLSGLPLPQEPEGRMLHRLLYLCSGSFSVMLAGEHFTAARDTLLFLPPQITAEITSPDNGGKVLEIGFFPPPFPLEENRLCSEEEYLSDLRYYALDGVQERLAHIPLVTPPSAACRYRQAAERICTELLRPAPGTKLLAAVGLQQLLAQISADSAAESRRTEQDTGRFSPTVSAVCDYLNAHYARRITLDELSETFHISRNYLCTLFCETTGMSIVEYLNACRLELGKAYLVNTAYSVRDIAQATGIGDEFYFSRLFKRHAGMSPSAFRVKFRAE